MSKIRVVHYHYSWLPLTETWLYDLVRFLPREVNSTIVCRKRCEGNAAEWPDIRIGSLSAHLKAGEAHLLHSHFGDFGWRNIAAARKAGVKHVVSFYGHDVVFLPKLDQAWKTRYRELFDHADAVLCEGEHMAETIIRGLGCPLDKIRVHRLGVDTDRIRYQPRSWDGKGKVRFLIAGAYREKKGIPDALRAIALARKALGEVDITIIGDASPSSTRMAPEKSKILSAVQDLGLSGCTRMLGFCPHEKLWGEAYRHHVFVSPSFTASDGDTEGGAPVTLIEMAASGMPIISTTHCDIPGTLGAQNRKLLAAERNVRGLAEAILALLGKSSWTSMLEENRQHVEKRFATKRQGLRLARLYHGLL